MEEEGVERTVRALPKGMAPPPAILERINAQANQKLINEILQKSELPMEEKYWQIIIGTRYGQGNLKKEAVTGKRYLPLYVQEKEKQGFRADRIWFSLYQRFMQGTEGAQKEPGFAAALAEHLVDSSDIEFLVQVVDILINDKQTNVAADLMYNLYQKYRDGGPVRKDREMAEQWLVRSLRTAANDNRKKELADIYAGQYTADEGESVEEYCLSRMAEDGILGAAHDYGAYLENHRQYDRAVWWYDRAGEYPACPGLIEAFGRMFYSRGDMPRATWWYLRGGQYDQAYAIIDIWDGAAIESVLPVWQQWHGKADRYTQSLVYMKDHPAGMRKLRTVQQLPSAMRSAMGFILLNVLFAAMELFSAQNKTIAGWLAALAVGGWLGWDLGRIDIPLWICAVWIFCMVCHNVVRRRKWYDACRLWEFIRAGNIMWHPAFEPLVRKFRDSAQYAESTKDTHQWEFFFTFLFLIAAVVFAGKYPHGLSWDFPIPAPIHSSAELESGGGFPVESAIDKNDAAEIDSKAPVKTEAVVSAEKDTDPQEGMTGDDAVGQESNEQVISIFNKYRQAVNANRYSGAWKYLSPELQNALGGYDQWKRNWGKNPTIMASHLQIVSNDGTTAVLSCDLDITTWTNRQKTVRQTKGQFTLIHGEDGWKIHKMMY